MGVMLEAFKRSVKLAKGAGLWGVIWVQVGSIIGVSYIFGLLSNLAGDVVPELIMGLAEQIIYLFFLTIPAIRYVQIRKAHTSAT